MKIHKFFLIGAAAALLAGAANAETINITGSTAFRAAIVKAIVDAFNGTGGSLTGAAYTGSSINGGNQQLFVGTYPSVSGTTYIRTCWNGSVEGVQALANPSGFPTTYIPTTATVSAVTTGGVTGAQTLGGGTLFGGTLVTDTPTFAYSDVYQVSTPVTSPTFNDDTVGVVPFQWVATPGAGASISNVTTQLANKLLTSGHLLLSQFTGNSADNGVTVYATGRYNGSGTRATTLAEIGYGVFNTVHQYYPVTTGANGTITNLTAWPDKTKADVGGTPSNDTTAGNGGFNSGGGVRDAMDCALNSSVWVNCTVNSNGTVNNNGTSTTGSNIALVAYLGIADAYSASTKSSHPAIALNYNGVGYTAAKVQNGQYTFWGYEHAMYGDSLSTLATQVKTDIATNVPGAFTFYGIAASPGLDATTMVVGRGSDGGLVTP